MIPQTKSEPSRTVIHVAYQKTTFGNTLIAATQKGVCAIRFGSKKLLRKQFTAKYRTATIVYSDDVITGLADRVKEIIDNPTQKIDVPLDMHGTPFQLEVWSALQQIPLGETATYSQIAAAVGRPKAVRAAANACGANPVAILVPCHRVVRSDGSLGGYYWGLEMKKRLLDREAAFLSAANNR